MRVASRVSLGNVDTRELALRETVNNLTLLRIHEVSIERVYWPIDYQTARSLGYFLACNVCYLNVSYSAQTVSQLDPCSFITIFKENANGTLSVKYFIVPFFLSIKGNRKNSKGELL